MTWRPNAETEAAAPNPRFNNLETEVSVPVAQALVIAGAWAVVVGLVVGLVVILARLPWWIVPLSMLGVIAGLFAWRVTALINERRRLLWKIEQATGTDIDKDGWIGKPRHNSAQDDDGLRLAYVHDPRRRQRQERAADFRFFLREAYNGRGTTWRAWDGVRLPSGRETKRPLWEMYTGRLLKAGLATREYDPRRWIWSATIGRR